MAEQHANLLDRLSGKVLVRSAEHIHAKFLVTDPGSSASARAWISTANFNKALHDNLEIGVRLEGPAARAVADVFQWAFWCEAERESRGAGRLAAIRPGYPMAPVRPADDAILATLCDSQHLRERVITMIGDARREVIVATYGLSGDHAAVRALVDAARRGVRVTVLTRPRPAVAEGAATLAAAAASVIAHEKLHAKALVVDGQALVMSANLEPQGLDRGFEVGALLSTEASRAVEDCLREWAASFPWVFRRDALRGEHHGEFCPAAASLRDGIVRVTDSHTPRLSPVIATDALALESAPTPPVPRPPRDELPRRMLLAWDVVAPTLPSAARERFREIGCEEPNTGAEPSARNTRAPYEPRVFDLGSEVYVLLEQHSDAARVREAAAALGAKVVVR
jgi:cardiolipin synthase